MINNGSYHAYVAHGFGCPHCAGAIERVARGWPDRLLSLWIPVRRYRCLSGFCGWDGILRHRHHETGASSVSRGRILPWADGSATALRDRGDRRA